MSETLTTDEALALMPLISRGKLISLRRQGRGPKFGQFANKVIYQRSEVLSWYEKFCAAAFTQTKVAPRTRSAEVGKKSANRKANALA